MTRIVRGAQKLVHLATEDICPGRIVVAGTPGEASDTADPSDAYDGDMARFFIETLRR
jgi:hypothetical protein